jgi:predicted enzyme related to lactoylglutathione lyase
MGSTSPRILSTIAASVIAMTLAGVASAAAQDQGRANALPFSEQVVFLYYADLAVAEAFFGTALGLSKSMDQDWVKIYRTAGGSSVGAVKEGRGYHRTASSKPVMVSWVVDDIDPWYRRLSDAGVKVLKPPQESAESGVRSFLVADPTGYTFEFMQWLRK